jgi:methionyl-tRNA formyltransferase
MRVVFMGTPDFAVASLDAIHQSHHEIVGVVTVPDRMKGRGLKIIPSAVKLRAMEYHYPVAQPAKLKDPNFIQQLNAWKPDIIVVVAFRILPQIVFNLPPFGSINCHGSLLPKYRGAAPIHWALLNGDTKTGVTTFQLDQKVDTGSMLLQKEIPISEKDNLGSIHDKLASLGAEAVVETLDGIEDQSLVPRHQDNTLATPARKVAPEDAELNFNESTEKIFNTIRAFNPIPGASTRYNGKRFKLFDASIQELNYNQNDLENGEIVKVNKTSFTVKCSDGFLSIFEVQLEGKKRLFVEQYLRGKGIQVGQILG